ncbi:MAG: lytic transglycosylase domain-containing protein [Spirochaetes bacterium]|nr:lytic transglycosylase domain-containing protein [Spirochaetota bacterium]
MGRVPEKPPSRHEEQCIKVISIPRRVLLPAAVSLLLLSCVNSGFAGLDKADWLKLLESGEALSRLNHQYIPYKKLAANNPGTLLYLGLHARQAGQTGLMEKLLEKSVELEQAPWRDRSLALLREHYDSSGQYRSLLKLLEAQAKKTAQTPPDPFEISLVQLKTWLSENEAEKAATGWEALMDQYPKQAAAQQTDIQFRLVEAWLNRAAATDKHDKKQAALLNAVQAGEPLSLQRTDTKLAGLFSRLANEATDVLSLRQQVLYQVRAAAGLRDYGLAVRSFVDQLRNEELQAGRLEPGQQLAEAVLAARFAELSFQEASDLARSWLYSSPVEGERLFRRLASSPAGDRTLPAELAYLYHFYAARFMLRSGKNTEAQTYLRAAVEQAASSADRAAALWYLADSYIPAAAEAAIAVLAEALQGSTDPAYFNDLLEPLSRRLLLDRNGRLLVRLAELSPLAEPGMRARLQYLAARAAETGIIKPEELPAIQADPGIWIHNNYIAAYEQAADPWYRLLAALRLDLQVPPQRYMADQTSLAALPEDSGLYGQYLHGLADWQLEAILYPEASSLFTHLEADDIRFTAEWLYNSGDYANSLRLGARLLARPGYQPLLQDRQLVWPRPFLSEMRTALAANAVEENLMYGLVRSESLFMPAVVSRAGAVGLSQLMPATAAEMAGRLRMSEWDSSDPADNLLIGSAYLKRLLDANDGRVLPALFSYNAGPGRYRSWRLAAGNLPLDLQLETLEYAETRQYGRNVLSAAVQYAVLYDEKNGAQYLRSLLNE